MSEDIIKQLEIDLYGKTMPNALAPIENGLSDAVGFNSTGFPQNQGYVGAQQITQATTIFKNMRWYLVSNMRQMLSEAYVEIGLIQTICDVPVDDGLRGGIEIKSKQLDEDQIEELQFRLDRKNDLVTAGQGVKWNRLYGGAGLLILTDQDPEEPLKIETINDKSKLDFRAVDMWELFWDKQETEGYDPAIQQGNFEYYNYYGEQVHKSRVMRLTGLTAPSFIRPRLRGWGFSVVEALIRSINQYLKATDLGFEVLDEFKLDVYKIKNLVQTLMSPGGEIKVKERVQLANWQKNYQNAVVMDSEDDFDHKQLSFAGLAEAMEGIRMQVAADMRMPITKLFGISASGFNSGEDDIEVYNAMVESQVRNKIKYHLLKICELRCQELFGFVPDDLDISFQPLRVMSAEQEENVKTQKFTRVLQATQAGLLTSEEFRDICNKSDLFDIVLDKDTLVDGYLADEVSTEGGEGGDSNGGANKIAGQKSLGAGGVKEPKTPKPPPTKNSIQFDIASYEADGGDRWVHPGRKHFFTDPGRSVDQNLWSQARDISQRAFGKVKWEFVVWKYKKMGGKFI